MRTATWLPATQPAHWEPLAGRALVVLVALLLLAGAADLLLQIHRMSDSLVTVNAHIQSMSAKLDYANAQLRVTNGQLRTTNGKLDLTNAQLGVTNRKLDRANAGLAATLGRLDRTNRGLAGMSASLVDMRHVLGAMRGDISHMSAKILHAKLLF